MVLVIVAYPIMITTIVNNSYCLEDVFVENKNKKWITSQIQLAAAAGLSPMTVTRAKSAKFKISLENYEALSKLTGISVRDWASGPRSALASKLRLFFRQQREGKIISSGQSKEGKR